METKVIEVRRAALWGRSFIFIMAANALLFMVFEMMLPTLPLFVSHLGGGASEIGMVTGVFMFSAILIRPFTAKLAARIDKKYLLLIGIAICAAMTGLYYLASGTAMILVLRVIHGFGFGIATTYFATLATENIPVERRGEGMGYFGVGETVAVSVGPLIGMSVLTQYDFHGLFFGGMFILLLALLMAVFVSRKPHTGTVEDQPEVPFKLIEKRVLFPSLLIMLIGVAAGSIMSFIALYAAEKGFDKIAWFFFIVALASFAVRLVSGKMFDRFGPGSVLVPSAVFMGVGIWLLTQSGSEAWFLVSAAVYGLGFGAVFPAIQTWCINLVDEHEHENAMASFFNFFDLGIGGGAMILGLVASAFSYEVVYDVAIAIMILYLLLYIGYARRKRNG
ncbi:MULTISPECIES: MFS transporter [Paenibacillus]|uniref:MFS transporter n=1 Tax=Paenibacillus campinasensis TaxID=66347 RepID=A0A268EE63_9BACL|nr:MULTISPECIES: MFS transporter [Paenibacillus]MUG68686.1 MFS transporter [Paenibacillus campinasensis]PAD71380.1 MFS transporter [Paenibacillus campinasensis]PAK50630.1 MFS transporter [Paenibacillus sp. 7541]